MGAISSSVAGGIAVLLVGITVLTVAEERNIYTKMINLLSCLPRTCKFHSASISAIVI
jgi:hypothetical protein